MVERALVVAAIIVDDLARPSLVMAARRASPPGLAGRWEFPGGKVEAGEDPIEGLRRELIEELQIDVTIGDEVLSPEAAGWPISDRYVMRTWLARIDGRGPSTTGSHDRIVWLAPSQLATLDWLDADVEIARVMQRRLAIQVGNPFPEQNGT